MPGSQVVESSTLVFCQGCWAVSPELLVATSPPLRANLRMKGTKNAELRGRERQTADTLINLDPAVPKDHTFGLFSYMG